MNVRTATFNKANWSGETATLKIREYADGRASFKLHGYEFTLSPVKASASEDGDDAWTFERRELTSRSWDYPLFSVGRFRKDSSWTASHYDVVREDSDPVLVAAKIIFMTV